MLKNFSKKKEIMGLGYKFGEGVPSKKETVKDKILNIAKSAVKGVVKKSAMGAKQ